MDTELLTQIIALLTGAWTVFQEIRHRKNNPKPAKTKDIFPSKPVRRG